MNTFVIYLNDGTQHEVTSNETLEAFTLSVIADKRVDEVGQKMWHVFADKLDDFYDNEAKALEAYNNLIEHRANVRLYWEVSDSSGATIEEDYIKGQGEYPD